MKKKIHNLLFDKMWKKSLIIFLIVFLIIFVGGLTSINYLNDVVTNHHVHTDVVTVVDKIYGDNSFSDYYIIVGSNNKTYSIPNHDDGHGYDMFNAIKINETYRFTVKEPKLTDINQFTHILQVNNATS